MDERPRDVPHGRTVVLEAGDPARIADRIRLDDGVGFLVRVVGARADVLFERLTGQGDATPRQFAVLLTLHQRGAMTLTQLATAIRTDRSTLGEMVKRMARRGLVSREPHPDDGRAATLSVAPDGHALLLRLVDGAARMQSELLAPLPAEDRGRFVDLLRRLADAE